MQAFEFRDMKWSLWDRWILEGDLTVQQVLDWFKVRLAAKLAVSQNQAVHPDALQSIISQYGSP